MRFGYVGAGVLLGLVLIGLCTVDGWWGNTRNSGGQVFRGGT